MIELPEPVAHAASDWQRAITESELLMIPNAGSNEGRRDRCRLLYAVPLYTASQMREHEARVRAEFCNEEHADAERTKAGFFRARPKGRLLGEDAGRGES